MALVACPTASIGTASKADVAAAASAFPEPIAGQVHYCGYASESSFGASSYLLVRPGGNVLIDSPRAARPLLDRIAALGGVRLMILTHRDDVADHDAIHRAFGCERVMHESDVDAGTACVERKVSGLAPVKLDADLTRDPGPRPHPRQRRAPPRRPAPLQRRPRLVRGPPRPAPRLAQRLLVLVARADPIHGAALGALVRVGLPGPRPPLARALARGDAGRGPGARGPDAEQGLRVERGRGASGSGARAKRQGRIAGRARRGSGR